MGCVFFRRMYAVVIFVCCNLYDFVHVELFSDLCIGVLKICMPKFIILCSITIQTNFCYPLLFEQEHQTIIGSKRLWNGCFYMKILLRISFIFLSFTDFASFNKLLNNFMHHGEVTTVQHLLRIFFFAFL